MVEIILGLFVLANMAIILYFFVYKNKQVDREYRNKIKSIEGLHYGPGCEDSGK